MSTKHRPGFALRNGCFRSGRVTRFLSSGIIHDRWYVTYWYLGDVFFHLLGEIFLSGEEGEHARFVMVDTNKNLLLGVAVCSDEMESHDDFFC